MIVHVNGDDLRVAVGTRCTWWDSISRVGHLESGIPCCPVCGGVLYEYPSEQAWLEAVALLQHHRGRKDHRAMVIWGRGHCYPSQDLLRRAYEDRLRGDLEVWCRENWNRVPEEQRLMCLRHLSVQIPAEVLEKFQTQHSRGERIAGDVLGFHFGGGMLVRNTLREVLPDGNLPTIKQQNGELAQNWDDFYTGALEELCEKGSVL